MPDKTKTVVIIESHEQTIIRRSRRVISSQLPAEGAVARPLGETSSEATERLAKRQRRWLAAWWRTVALKGATALAPLSRRTKVNERKNRLS